MPAPAAAPRPPLRLGPAAHPAVHIALLIPPGGPSRPFRRQACRAAALHLSRNRHNKGHVVVRRNADMLHVNRHRAVRAGREQVGNTTLIHRELKAHRHPVEFARRFILGISGLLSSPIASGESWSAPVLQPYRRRNVSSRPCRSKARARARGRGIVGGTAHHAAHSAHTGKVANRCRKGRPFDRGVLANKHLFDALDGPFGMLSG